MAKFKFKLETVLKVKLRVEDLRKKELKEAEVRRDQAKIALLRRQEEVAEAVESYRKQFAQQSVDIYLANDYHRFLTWLNKLVDLAVLHLHHCEQAVVETRQRLIEASKERKILEKLKVKAYEVYKAEELKAEIEFLDELGTGRFVRREGND
jgi:flagellar protein FliJ